MSVRLVVVLLVVCVIGIGGLYVVGSGGFDNFDVVNLAVDGDTASTTPRYTIEEWNTITGGGADVMANDTPMIEVVSVPEDYTCDKYVSVLEDMGDVLKKAHGADDVSMSMWFVEFDTGGSLAFYKSDAMSFMQLHSEARDMLEDGLLSKCPHFSGSVPDVLLSTSVDLVSVVDALDGVPSGGGGSKSSCSWFCDSTGYQPGWSENMGEQQAASKCLSVNTPSNVGSRDWNWCSELTGYMLDRQLGDKNLRFTDSTGYQPGWSENMGEQQAASKCLSVNTPSNVGSRDWNWCSELTGYMLDRQMR